MLPGRKVDDPLHVRTELCFWRILRSRDDEAHFREQCGGVVEKSHELRLPVGGIGAEIAEVAGEVWIQRRGAVDVRVNGTVEGKSTRRAERFFQLAKRRAAGEAQV